MVWHARTDASHTMTAGACSIRDTEAGPHLVQLFVYPPRDGGAVRGDDYHDDGQTLLGVGPRLQPARLERFGVVVAVPFLLVPGGPLALVGLELLYPARVFFFSVRVFDGSRWGRISSVGDDSAFVIAIGPLPSLSAIAMDFSHHFVKNKRVLS